MKQKKKVLLLRTWKNLGRVITVAEKNVAIVAIIVAVVALAFTIFQGKQQREHDRLSVRPILQISRYLGRRPGRSELGVFLKNEGAGIAIIDTLTVRLVGVEGKEDIVPDSEGKGVLEVIAGAIRAEHPHFPLIHYYVSIAGALAPNSEKALFTVDASLLTSDWQPVWQDYLSRMTIHIEYKSLYNERFVVDMLLVDQSSTGKEITIMSDYVMASMISCSGLEPAEQEKVERLAELISAKFFRAGYAVPICQGRIDGDRRVLDFCGPAGTIASVSASDFLAASDPDAVAMITPSLLD